MLRRDERMVDQDPPLIIDDQKLEPARQDGLAACQQHLPAERHNVATQAGRRGSAITDAASTGLRSRRPYEEPAERAVSPRVAHRSVTQCVRGPKRGDG